MCLFFRNILNRVCCIRLFKHISKMLMTLRILYFTVFRCFFSHLLLVIVSHDTKQFSMYRIISSVEMIFVFELVQTHKKMFFSFSIVSNSNRFKIVEIKESFYSKCVRNPYLLRKSNLVSTRCYCENLFKKKGISWNSTNQAHTRISVLSFIFIFQKCFW